MTAPQPDLAGLLEATPLGQRIAGIVARWAFGGGHDGPTMAAIRILADPDSAPAVADAPAVAALRARHQPRRWADGSQTVVCACGAGSWPCVDAAILAGER